jgi:hypothetical protein
MQMNGWVSGTNAENPVEKLQMNKKQKVDAKD